MQGSNYTLGGKSSEIINMILFLRNTNACDELYAAYRI